MRIQHNIAALNAHRQLGNNNTSVSKNLEKLSSGYRINRAGDDAAGLAISEKMRAQITGLETAQKNANDGISLVQTAEGALTEVHSMLNRMVELAEQSANGTYQDAVDRDNLQKEFDSLRSEINRISEGTNFNGINLLDGSLGGPKMSSTKGVATVDSVPGTTPGTAPTTTNATTATVTGTEGDGTDAATLKVDLAGMSVTAPTDGSTGSKVTISIAGEDIDLEITGDMDDKAIAAALAGKTIVVDGETFTAALDTAGGTALTFTAGTTNNTTGVVAAATGGDAAIAGTAGTSGGTDAVAGSATEKTLDFDGRTGADLIGGTMKIGGTTYSFVENAADAADGTTAITIAKDATADDIATAIQGAVTVDGFTGTADGSKFVLTETAGAANADGNDVYAGIDAPDVSFDGIGLTLQIGDTPDSFNQLTVSVGSMNTTALGIADIDISTQSGAKGAIELIKNAINTVSSTRGDLGALQNRLEHTINNLSVTTENMTAAESRIRDVDMAEEMMNFTKNNILTQASQAMLAQANQLPQGVLQLLQ